MSEQFFEELDIPEPDYNLGISGGTHAQMTGKMMIAIEEVLMKEKPDWLLVLHQEIHKGVHIQSYYEGLKRAFLALEIRYRQVWK